MAATPGLHDPSLMRKPTPDPYSFYTGSVEGAAALMGDLLVHRSVSDPHTPLMGDLASTPHVSIPPTHTAPRAAP